MGPADQPPSHGRNLVTSIPAACIEHDPMPAKRPGQPQQGQALVLLVRTRSGLTLSRVRRRARRSSTQSGVWARALISLLKGLPRCL